MITKEQLQELDDLFIRIEISNEIGLDEVNINGNGCSAFEVSRCIHAVYDLLGLTKPEITENAIDQYLISIGEDPEDYR